MTGGMRLDGWREDVEFLHCSVETACEILCYLHWFELLKACFLSDFVLAFVGIMLEMAYVSDVAYIAHLVSYVLKIAVKDVECDGRACVSEVCIAVNCRSADVHSYVTWVDRLEGFLLSGEGVVY